MNSELSQTTPTSILPTISMDIKCVDYQNTTEYNLLICTAYQTDYTNLEAKIPQSAYRVSLIPTVY